MKSWLPAAILVALFGAGCIPHVAQRQASLAGQKEYGVIQMGPSIGYLIDPRTESCVLVYASSAATQVSCSKLKGNVPEAAAFITWIEESAPATAN